MVQLENPEGPWYNSGIAQAEINGIKIYYELSTQDAPKGTVAFLNGVMASASSWSYFADFFFRAGYNILLHDFRGQLLSDKPPGEYTFSRHAEDTLSLFRHLEIHNPHLVGTSYGGEVAMRLAADHPDVPATLSIIDSVSETDDVLNGFIDLWIDLAEQGDPERFFWGMVPTVYSDSYIRNNHAFLEKRALRLGDVPRDYFSGQVSLYKTFKNDVVMTNDLNAITCPCLVVCGEKDILKPVAFSRIIAAAIKGARFVTVPDAGHALFIEKPEILGELLLGFISAQNLYA